jgi:hypothetical protein
MKKQRQQRSSVMSGSGSENERPSHRKERANKRMQSKQKSPMATLKDLRNDSKHRHGSNKHHHGADKLLQGQKKTLQLDQVDNQSMGSTPSIRTLKSSRSGRGHVFSGAGRSGSR